MTALRSSLGKSISLLKELHLVSERIGGVESRAVREGIVPRHFEPLVSESVLQLKEVGNDERGMRLALGGEFLVDSDVDDHVLLPKPATTSSASFETWRIVQSETSRPFVCDSIWMADVGSMSFTGVREQPPPPASAEVRPDKQRGAGHSG